MGNKKGTILHIKALEGLSYDFNGFDAPFSKSLNFFFTIVFTCRFYCLYSRMNLIW